ncbi:MAG TPA: 30S ribosomal protein S9 [Candidatus Dojkabacteria bacterium]|jgi:small subunit ribosomal protein S9
MDKYFYAVGRRKESTATIRLFEGKGESTVNGTPVDKKFNLLMERKEVLSPLTVAEIGDKFYFSAKVKGGGKAGQIGAVRHALARSIIKADLNYRAVLKKAGFLTRDDRKVERKKTGLVKARKAPQFSKR